ncbi:MAG: hypothetical protein AAF581_16380 [Planctomycetota bacterium]
MGSKGPILIVAMGVGCVVVLGFIAQFALEKQPGLKLGAEFRKDAVARFPITQVTLQTATNFCNVHLTVDPKALPAVAASAPLPAELTEFPRYFRENYPPPFPAKPLKLSLVKEAAGLGCGKQDTVLWEGESPTVEELAEAGKRVQAQVGSGRVSSDTPASLLVEIDQSLRADQAKELLPHVLSTGGGGWRRVEFRCGKVRFAFDGNGERVFR